MKDGRLAKGKYKNAKSICVKLQTISVSNVYVLKVFSVPSMQHTVLYKCSLHCRRLYNVQMESVKVKGCCEAQNKSNRL